MRISHERNFLDEKVFKCGFDLVNTYGSIQTLFLFFFLELYFVLKCTAVLIVTNISLSILTVYEIYNDI